jgi:hypothetical protein
MKDLSTNAKLLHPQDGISFDPISGWILGPSKELILWIPVHHRAGLWRPRNTTIIGVQPTELDLSQFHHGTAWVQCYNGPKD